MKSLDKIPNFNDEELYAELSVADEIIAYYEAIKKLALDKAIAGKEWPGYVLKTRSGTRKITDTNSLVNLAKTYGIQENELYEIKLLSVPSLEKAFKVNKEFIKELGSLVSTGESTHTLQKVKEN